MNLMTFKIGILGRAYNPDYTSRFMRPKNLTFCGSGGITCGDLFYLYCKLQAKYFEFVYRYPKVG